MERSLLVTMFHSAAIRSRVIKQLSVKDFFDLEAMYLFRNYSNGAVIPTITFTEPPLQEEEINNAVQQIKDAAWMREVGQHGKLLAERAQRGDKDEVLKLMARAPLSAVNDTHVDIGQGVAQTTMGLIGDPQTYLQPTSKELLALDLEFYPGSILNIAAKPGVGKSSLGEQIALDLTAQGAWFLDISVELNQDMRVERYMQHVGGKDFSPRAFSRRRVDMSRYRDVASQFFKINLDGRVLPRKLTIDAKAFSLPDVIQSIRGFKQDYDAAKLQAASEGYTIPGPPIIMLDYLQLVSVPEAHGEIYKKVNATTHQLYELSKDLQISMIWVAQFKKQDTRAKVFQPDRLPDADDIESGADIDKLAHTMLFLHRPTEAWTSKGWTKTIAYATKNRRNNLYHLEGAYSGESLTFNFNTASITAPT